MSETLTGRLATGVPYELDKKKIRERWPIEQLKPGVEIFYTAVAAVTGLSVRDPRFYAVTESWLRDIHRDSGCRIFLKRCGRHKELNFFRVCDDSDRHVERTRRTTRAKRELRVSAQLIDSIDRAKLSDQQRAEHDHACERMAKISALLRLRNGAASEPQ